MGGRLKIKGMENFQQKFEGRSGNEKKIVKFKMEVQHLKNEEMKKKKEREMKEAKGEKGESYDPHFINIFPEYLDADDTEAYRKYKEGIISRNDSLDYDEKCAEKIEELRKRLGGAKEDEKIKIQRAIDSKENFRAWFLNKVSIKFMEGQRKEIEEKDKKRLSKNYSGGVA